MSKGNWVVDNVTRGKYYAGYDETTVSLLGYTKNINDSVIFKTYEEAINARNNLKQLIKDERFTVEHIL